MPLRRSQNHSDNKKLRRSYAGIRINTGKASSLISPILAPFDQPPRGDSACRDLRLGRHPKRRRKSAFLAPLLGPTEKNEAKNREAAPIISADDLILALIFDKNLR